MIKIELESVDGGGKTTALKYLLSQAKSLELSALETREVGNPNIPVCVKMRELVLDPNSGLSGESMELIFSAMRIENDKWMKNLRESENAPDLLLSDRGWLSHLAYTDHNVSVDYTNGLYLDLISGLTELPDVVIYFDVSTDTALKRRIKRGEGMDVIEQKGVEFQEKVRKSFEKYIEEYKKYSSINFFVVDANQDLDNVKKQLDNILFEIRNSIQKKPSELMGMC